jgi:hypothetical protein
MGDNWTKLLDILASPLWWFSVVFAGICINILSAYLKNTLDDRLSKISTWWRNRSEIRKQKFEDCVQAIADEPRKLLIACYTNIIRSILTSILFIILLTIIFLNSQFKDNIWLFCTLIFLQFLLCFFGGIQFGKIMGLNSIIIATLSKIRDE